MFRLTTRTAGGPRLPRLLEIGLVVAVAAAGFSPTLAQGVVKGKSANTLPAKVYVQGDSLTLESAATLKALAKPSTVTIDAKIGRHAYQGIALMRKVKVFPEAVVVALGTNDDYDPYGTANFKSHIQTAMGLLGKTRCVVWVNLFQQRTAKQVKAKSPMIFTGMNAVLAGVALTTPTFHVVDWAKMSGYHPEWYRYDPVHPSEAGYLARVNAIIATLKTCGTLGGGGGVTPTTPTDGGGGSPGPA